MVEKVRWSDIREEPGVHQDDGLGPLHQESRPPFTGQACVACRRAAILQNGVRSLLQRDIDFALRPNGGSIRRQVDAACGDWWHDY